MNRLKHEPVSFKKISVHTRLLNIETEEDDLTRLGKFFQWSDKFRVKVTTGQVGCRLRNKSSGKEMS